MPTSNPLACKTLMPVSALQTHNLNSSYHKWQMYLHLIFNTWASTWVNELSEDKVLMMSELKYE